MADLERNEPFLENKLEPNLVGEPQIPKVFDEEPKEKAKANNNARNRWMIVIIGVVSVIVIVLIILAAVGAL